MASWFGVIGEALSLSVSRAGASGSPDDHEQLLHLQEQVDAINAAAASAATRSHIVSAVLLFGLLVEIVGALFLAGPALTAKQEPVLSLKARPGWQDLTFHDLDGDKRVNFLGAVGAVFLSLGFVIQFGGTLYSLAVSWRAGVFAVSTASAVALGIFYFLLGQSPQQSRTDKLRILWMNFRRLVTPDVGCRCDCCNRRVNSTTATVRWRETPAHEVAPYLHPPRAWHVGHPRCLDESGWFEPLIGLDGHEEDAVKRASMSEFLTRVPDFEKWWEAARHHAAQLPSARGRTPDSLASPAEGEYRVVLKKVQRLRR